MTDYAALRRDLHRHPELGFEEHRTSAVVVEHLKRCGVDEVHTGLGHTGVVGIVRGALGEGERIGLRADMDCLPMTEENTFAHASCQPGKMHGCGHDGHTTILLATAEALCQHRQFRGEVVLIFQPAEEGHGGAAAMVADGLLTRFPMKRVYALHNFPGIPQGHIHLRPGPMMASSDRFRIRVQGKGGHGAMPHLAVDPVLVAAHILVALQSLVSRSQNPIRPAVVSCTKVQAGEATNVIPDHAVLEGTFRAFDPEDRARIGAQMATLAAHTAQAFGASAETTLNQGDHIGYPAVINAADATEIAQAAARAVVGDSAVKADADPVPGSEDFSFIAEQVPSCYVLMGNDRGSEQDQYFLHHPRYDFNDALIPTGVAYFAKLVELELG
ncbi:M20 aminoacylase family protein [Ferrimonas balearica]|uniref:M20 aminoacylase family protein n=1 Tax=Ferrimonas balearica TaxID=44012 RepID=UPI001C996F1C|nr:M20 aminoacylase family protein [Ferrimonas balearica]MBY5992476.1 amidohydrolase [Ferrimonas balearica]